MKLIIKQQFFTLFDKFDVYDEGDNIVYTVEGQFALTKTLSVLDHDGNEAAKLTRRFFTILPTFDIEVDGEERIIILRLKIDTEICPVMEYFEIFLERMVLCKKSAARLGCSFELIINDTRLL